MPATPPKMVDSLPEGKGRGPVKVTAMKVRGVVAQPEHRHRTRVAEKPFLMEHDILKVTNIDGVAWEFKWDRRSYVVRPGETGYVPFPAVVLKMGDPRSVEGAMTRFNSEDGQRGVIASRYDSLTTLFATYGIENENIDDLVDFAPKLEVRTMDGDELVTFPVQNPDMVAWPVPQVALPGRENSDTKRLIDNLRAENEASRDEIAELRSLVTQRLGGDTVAPAPEPAGDEPDVLAAALSGATVDQGPSTQLG